MKQNIEFVLNEEFEERMMNGQKVKSVINFKDNTMIHTQNSDPPIRIVRNFFSDEMVEMVAYGNLICTNWYKAV